MQVKSEHIPSLSVVYMRRTGQYGEENYALMRKMKQWVQDNGLWIESGVIYGIAQDNTETTPLEKCRYDVCCVTDSVFDDNTIQHGTLPSGEYLVFEIPHTAEDVGRFYASIGEFLTKEKRQYDESRPILERYRFALVESGRCEFCVPIL